MTVRPRHAHTWGRFHYRPPLCGLDSGLDRNGTVPAVAGQAVRLRTWARSDGVHVSAVNQALTRPIRE